jgi:hypothetical protein
MDEAYWRERCAAAEAALAKARRGLPLSAHRKAILAALAELKTNETIDTIAASELLMVGVDNAFATLCKMSEVGLVERTPGRRGPCGEPSRWRLGHLVQVTE